MNKRSALIHWVTVLMLLAVPGCISFGGGGIIGPPPPDYRHEGYLPFVSAMTGPALAVEGEPVMITLQLSASQYPDLLRAVLPEDRPSRIAIWLQVSGNEITLVPLLRPYEEGNPPPQGQHFSEYSFDLQARDINLLAGQTYTLRITTSTTEETGGMPVVWDTASDPGTLESDLPVEYKELDITIE